MHRAVTIDNIIDASAEITGVTREEIVGASRVAKIVTARSIAMYLARRMTIKSLPELAVDFCCRSHSTIHEATSKIAKQIESGERAKNYEDKTATVAGLVEYVRVAAVNRSR